MATGEAKKEVKKKSTKELVEAWLAEFFNSSPLVSNAQAYDHFEKECRPALLSVADDLTPAKVSQWFADKVCNSPISQNTVLCNHVIQAKDELIRRLA